MALLAVVLEVLELVAHEVAALAAQRLRSRRPEEFDLQRFFGPRPISQIPHFSQTLLVSSYLFLLAIDQGQLLLLVSERAFQMVVRLVKAHNVLRICPVIADGTVKECVGVPVELQMSKVGDLRVAAETALAAQLHLLASARLPPQLYFEERVVVGRALYGRHETLLQELNVRS